MTQIKRVACLIAISKKNQGATFSKRLMDVFNFVRTYKKAHRVEGVLLVCDNQTLLILEGEQHTLADLIYRLGRDTIVKSSSTIVNMNDDALFDNWRIKFVDAQKDQAYLNTIYQAIKSHISTENNAQSKSIERLFNQGSEPNDEAKQQKTTQVDTLTNKIFRLKSWPRPQQIKMSPEMMKLCALLLRKKISYNALQQSSLMPSENVLNDSLFLLLNNNLLTIEEVPPAPVTTRMSINTAKTLSHLQHTNQRFGVMLKHFIHSVSRR